MAWRLTLIGSCVLLVCACQKNRGDIEATSSASGTAISASGNGSGGAGGSIAGTGGDATASTGTSGGATSASSGGEGGDPSTGGGSPSSTGAGGEGPIICGDDVACWGDEPSLCTTSICAEAFIECAPEEPSPFAYACGTLQPVLRTGVWAHVVDCMREAGSDVECDGGEAAVAACLDEARAEVCPSEAVDDLCDAAEVSCPGFDVDACKSEIVLLVQASVGDYQSCVELGGDCATLHDLCLNGSPDP